jgi:hypothetical protein
VTQHQRLAATVLALAAWSSRVTAQPSSAEAALAIQLFDDAEKLMAAGQPAAACPKYAESQRRDPQLGTLLHLADCHEKVGKIASAWAGFKEAAEIASRRNAAGGNERREQVARARAAELEPKLSGVLLHVAQVDVAGLEIRRDGELLSRAVWGSTMPVDPGRYTFLAQAPGKKAWTKTVEVRSGGAKIEITVPALEDDGAPSAAGMSSPISASPPIDAASSSTADRQERGSTQRTVGYLLAGLGVIGAGVGVAFGLTVVSQLADRDAICRSGAHCTPDEGQRITDIEARAQGNATACNVALALGGAAALGGVALVLTAPSSRSSTAARIDVVPWAGPQSAGANVAGHW